MTGEKGVTLMEATVTLVIVGIVGAMAVPGIAKWAQTNYLKGAVSTLYNDIAAARLCTIKDKVRHSLKIDGTLGQWQIFHVGANGINENGAGDDVILKTRNLSEFGTQIVCGIGQASASVTGVGLSGPDFTTYGAGRVTFNAMGECNAGFFYLANGDGGTFAVGTLSSGVVRIRQWKSTRWE